jgi:hypothetical protein
MVERVAVLASATPIDSRQSVSIAFYNSNIQNEVPIMYLILV